LLRRAIPRRLEALLVRRCPPLHVPPLPLHPRYLEPLLGRLLHRADLLPADRRRLATRAAVLPQRRGRRPVRLEEPTNDLARDRVPCHRVDRHLLRNVL